MPTYEYECRKCGYVFEEFQPITAAPRARCPKCRGKVERLISAGIGIVFKGSGFYVTDSRKSNGDKEKSPQDRTAVTRAKPGEDGPAKSDGGPGNAADRKAGPETRNETGDAIGGDRGRQSGGTAGGQPSRAGGHGRGRGERGEADARGKAPSDPSSQGASGARGDGGGSKNPRKT